MTSTEFYLAAFRELDFAYAEHLYNEATSQCTNEGKDILLNLSLSLKLGHAESGWVLVNFIRPEHGVIHNSSEKLLYLFYLVATVLLGHEVAEQEFKRFIVNGVPEDLKILQAILRHYRTLQYDVDAWERRVQCRRNSRQLQASMINLTATWTTKSKQSDQCAS